ncbi:hypothetical protein [Microtetraspora niveoalba]|uniref:hypothetical protein n=1 Tax=Microtetraspora niveoalba TaxID=46175 RepID=UPI00082B4933|nr:hypothetical protein [Microtetraspora niveoalba]
MTVVLGPDDAIDPGWATARSVTEVSDLVRAGRTVAVTLPEDATEAVATAAVFAWAGARVFRATPETARDVRLAVEMTECLAGRRPPALTRRGLA